MQFERCLRENQTAAQVCSPQVAHFVACAETVDIGAVGELYLFVIYAEAFVVLFISFFSVSNKPRYSYVL